jgi:hypothetical protein
MSKSLSRKRRKSRRNFQFFPSFALLNLLTFLLLLFWLWRYLQNGEVYSSMPESMTLLDQHVFKVLINVFKIVSIFIIITLAYLFIRKRSISLVDKMLMILCCFLALVSANLIQVSYSTLNLWQSSSDLLLNANTLVMFFLLDLKGRPLSFKETLFAVISALVQVSIMIVKIIVPY